MKRFFCTLLTLSFFVLMLNGCGDEKTSESVDLGKYEKEEASQEVKASEGGEVKTDSASVKIPAGALKEDTTITISSEDVSGKPDESSLASFVFNFGPDGTEFNKDVTLSINLGADIPSGKTASIFYLNGEKWEEVGVSVKNLKKGVSISADVKHFSKFVIKLVDDKVVVESDGCDKIKFSKCGGDITGKWNITDFCAVQDQSIEENEDIPEACKNGGMSYNFEFDWAGSYIEFKDDNTYIAAMDPKTTETQMIYTDACLSAITQGMMPPADYCAKMNEQESQSCKYESSKCICDVVQDEEEDSDNPPDTGTYSTTADGILTIDKETDKTDGEYCVSGSKLMLKIFNKDEETGKTTEVVYAFEK